MMKLFRSFFFGLLVVAAVFVPAALRAQREAQAAKQNTSEARISAEDLRRALAPHVKDLAIDENRLRTHVMRPQHIIGVISDHGRDEGKIEFLPRRPIVGPLTGHHLDVDAFTKALHAALKDQVAGYAMRLRQHGPRQIALLDHRHEIGPVPADGDLRDAPVAEVDRAEQMGEG